MTTLFAARHITVRTFPSELEQSAERAVDIIPRANGYHTASDFADTAIVRTEPYIYRFTAQKVRGFYAAANLDLFSADVPTCTHHTGNLYIVSIDSAHGGT